MQSEKVTQSYAENSRVAQSGNPVKKHAKTKRRKGRKVKGNPEL
jgi:hypothetical protein